MSDSIVADNQEEKRMKLTQLLERLEYEVVQGSDEIEVTELINDSMDIPMWQMWRRKVPQQSL